MSPIVNRLSETYTDRLSVRFLNAMDNADGQRAFETLALPGHPSYVLYDEHGAEVWRLFGVVVESLLIQQIEKVVD